MHKTQCCRECKSWSHKAGFSGNCATHHEETTSWSRCYEFKQRTRDDERYRIVNEDGYVCALPLEAG